ncbi:MAG: type II toxin-antitoxin system VapC family toxin [Acidobacteria bacterium]|nr:type II toxin-antitoxin system VapC family toxin [Acidobacteriota bacterium]
MSRIFWDSNLFVYLIEDAGPRGEKVMKLRKRMIDRGDVLCTSTMTLGEVLVKPIQLGRNDLVERYEQALTSGSVLLIPFDAGSARTYAGVRQDRSIRAPDAVQLSCAAEARCDMFITNDDRLSRKAVPGIQFIVPLEKAFL